MTKTKTYTPKGNIIKTPTGQVFEYLGEQIEDNAERAEDIFGEVRVVSVDSLKHIIDEAKAKCDDSDDSAIMELLQGKWVDSDRVQKALGMTFGECWSMFEFSRTSAWWSIVGETEEERAREGMKTTILFRVKREVE